MKRPLLISAVLGMILLDANLPDAGAQVLSYTPGGYAGYLPYGGYASPTFDPRYSYTVPFNPPTYTFASPIYPPPPSIGYYSVAPYGATYGLGYSRPAYGYGYGYSYPGFGYGVYGYGYPVFGGGTSGYSESGYRGSKFSGGFGLSNSSLHGW